MLPSTSAREALLACSPLPLWNLPSFTMESALAHLDSLPPYDLVLWTDGSVPFFFAEAALAYLPTAVCGTEATLSFPASPVCSSFSAEAYPILQAL